MFFPIQKPVFVLANMQCNGIFAMLRAVAEDDGGKVVNWIAQSMPDGMDDGTSLSYCMAYYNICRVD